MAASSLTYSPQNVRPKVDLLLTSPTTLAPSPHRRRRMRARGDRNGDADFCEICGCERGTAGAEREAAAAAGAGAREGP